MRRYLSAILAGLFLASASVPAAALTLNDDRCPEQCSGHGDAGGAGSGGDSGGEGGGEGGEGGSDD